MANLNIEATYAAINGYEEYPNLCFVDTLDNTIALKNQKGQHVGDLFGGVSDENVARIKRQNKRKISVIIGNPPYNANQLNENENNKNREYPEIDRRIKATYIDASTAQKTKLYDMYARFFRWASDRVDENGIVAFVSNSSFIDSRTYDGFRKIVAKEFNHIWIVDLKGNARTSGERRRKEGGNIFSDQIRVGVAIYFCVKKKGLAGCSIHYEAVDDYTRAEGKREFLNARSIDQRDFSSITPDPNGNWINQVENDFDSLIPLIDRATKAVSIAAQERAVFKLFSNGVNTARDEWVFDLDAGNLKNKTKFLTSTFNKTAESTRGLKGKALTDELDKSIKWSEALIHRLKEAPVPYRNIQIRNLLYRPFHELKFFCEPVFSDRLTSVHKSIFGEEFDQESPLIAFSGSGSSKPFQSLAASGLFSFDLLEKTQAIPRYRFVERERVDNITDWALDQFRLQYENGKKPRAVSTKMPSSTTFTASFTTQFIGKNTHKT